MRVFFIVLFAAGLFVPASAGGQEVIDSAPDAGHQAALDKLAVNQITEAVRLLEESIRDNPQYTDSYLVLAAVHEQDGEYQEAIDVLESGVGFAILDRHTFYFNIGNNYYALREYDDSIAAYRNALALQADYVPAQLNLANAYVRGREYQSAIDTYEQYLDTSIDDAQGAEVRSMLVVLRGILSADQERERLLREREQRLLSDALSSLDGSSAQAGDIRAPPAGIIDGDDAVDIIE